MLCSQLVSATSKFTQKESIIFRFNINVLKTNWASRISRKKGNTIIRLPSRQLAHVLKTDLISFSPPPSITNEWIWMNGYLLFKWYTPKGSQPTWTYKTLLIMHSEREQEKPQHIISHIYLQYIHHWSYPSTKRADTLLWMVSVLSNTICSQFWLA